MEASLGNYPSHPCCPCKKTDSREVSRPIRKDESALPYVGTLGVVASAAYLHRKLKKVLTAYIKSEFERDNPDIVLL